MPISAEIDKSSKIKNNNKIDSNNNDLNLIISDKSSSASYSISPISGSDTSISFNNSTESTKENLVQQQEYNKNIKYGELIVLGHNGSIKAEDLGKSSRRRSKFSLQIKDKPNGVKPYIQHNCQSSNEVNNLIQKNHSVTYTLSRNHTVVVQYTRDEKTDMFQIGRSTESAIDFIVLDTILPVEKSDLKSEVNNIPQSTISRFACRIVVDREFPHTARIYAAGFDSSKRIFLGEKATKWKNEKGDLDGVTTNGVLIMHPSNGFYSTSSEYKQVAAEWMEVSVCGQVFKLNESRLTPDFKLNNIRQNETEENLLHSNILRDGTLIDLCGATLLWRSVHSLKKTLSKNCLEMNLENLNRLKLQCPVGFKTLVFPSSSHLIDNKNNNSSNNRNHLNNINNNILAKSSAKIMDRTPMVYLKCGHVHGHHNWGKINENERECPLCRKVGPYVQLIVGLESSFYCDLTSNEDKIIFKPYAFLPCGHMASEDTCKYWSKCQMPQGVHQGLIEICPFCAVPLCKEQPFVKLIFQEGF